MIVGESAELRKSGAPVVLMYFCHDVNLVGSLWQPVQQGVCERNNLSPFVARSQHADFRKVIDGPDSPELMNHGATRVLPFSY